MEESGETDCSKISDNGGINPFEKNYDEDELINESKNESFKVNNGGSSSNSTVEESDNNKKPYVRPYVRSKMARLRWTSDLHLRFVRAIERLGGEERATPKLVLQLMNIKGLNIAHVKSHLQMYRSKKIDDPNQGMIMDQRFFMDGLDRNIYNLAQLPHLPTFNQGHNSNFMRYGDTSWTTRGRDKWLNNSTISHNTSNKPGSAFYNDTLTERILSSHYFRSSPNIDPCSRINEVSTCQANQDLNEKIQSLHKQETRPGHYRQNPISLDHSPSLGQTMSFGLKRKALDWGLDLDLSLCKESRSEVPQDDENLSLSLDTSPSSLKKNKVRKEDFGYENARGVSTLDLTL